MIRLNDGGPRTTTPCPHHYRDVPTALACTRLDVHVSGHVYESTSGVPDCPKEEA